MVFPENMRKLDTENSSESLKTLEDYISYMQERIDFSIGHLRAEYITVGNLGGSNGIIISPEGITLGSDCKISWSAIEDKPTIPSSTSDLINDSGFINSEVATTITRNTVTTSYVNALNVTATNIKANSTISNNFTCSNLTLTGGSIQIATSSLTEDIIGLSYGTYFSFMEAQGFISTETSSGKVGGVYHSSIISSDERNNTFSAMVPNGIEVKDTYNNVHSIITSAAIESTYIRATQFQENGTSLASKYATLSYVQSNYAPYTHYHNQYYEEGDTPYFSKVWVTNPGHSSNYSGFYVGSSGYQLCEWRSSSQKYKDNIIEITNSLKDRIKDLYDIQMKEWKYKEGYLIEGDPLENKMTFGLIAEDVNEILPDIVYTRNDEVENYRDREFINALLVLIQDLNERLKVLENGNN